jgi:outer membrane protein TolC
LGISRTASLAALLLIFALRLAAQEIETGAHHVELPHRPLTLHDCIAIALGESPKLDANRLDLLAAGEEIRAAQASLWPNLRGLATGEGFSGEPTGVFRLTKGGATQEVGFAGAGVFGLNAQYPIFKDGSFFGLNDAPVVERERAKKNALAWTANLTREDVIYRITQNFVDTVSAQNRMQPIERRVALLQQSVDITKEQQTRGLLLPIDVKVVSDELNGARYLSKSIHERAAAGSLGLTRLLGLPYSTHIRLASALPDLPPPPDAKQLVQTVVALHPSLQAQRATIERAKQDYRLERYRLYPSLTLHASTTYITNFDNEAHDFFGGVTVDVPIFDFGMQLATMRARRDTFKAEQARFGSVTDDLVSEVVGVYSDLDSLSSKILSLQGEIGKLDRDLRVAKSQQQQGITPPLTAIDAELRLLDKRDELEIDEARRLVLYATLQKAMGGTWKWIP